MQQSLAAVKAAKDMIVASGTPFARPDDYFAEMIKTDDHMQRVRARVLSDRQSVDRMEQAKRSREMRKFGKTVQRQVRKQCAESMSFSAAAGGGGGGG